MSVEVQVLNTRIADARAIHLQLTHPMAQYSSYLGQEMVSRRGKLRSDILRTGVIPDKLIRICNKARRLLISSPTH